MLWGHGHLVLIVVDLSHHYTGSTAGVKPASSFGCEKRRSEPEIPLCGHIMVHRANKTRRALGVAAKAAEALVGVC